MRIGIAVAATMSLLAVAACNDGITPPCTDLARCAGNVASQPAPLRGQLVANAECAGCHGVNLRGDVTGDVHTPSLAVVRSYSPEQFDALLCTGRTLGNGAVDDVMTANGISALPAADRQALYAYLVAYVNEQ